MRIDSVASLREKMARIEANPGLLECRALVITPGEYEVICKLLDQLSDAMHDNHYSDLAHDLLAKEANRYVAVLDSVDANGSIAS